MHLEVEFSGTLHMSCERVLTKEFRKDIPNLQNSICGCYLSAVGKDDATGSQQEATSRSLQVNVSGSLELISCDMCTLTSHVSSICHWNYFQTSKDHVTWLI